MRLDVLRLAVDVPAILLYVGPGTVAIAGTVIGLWIRQRRRRK